MKKVCFVIMGFGKKMDYRNSKIVDLNIIYNKVIKRLFSEQFKQFKVIRADEINGSDIIDVSMYTLLLKADLVIADITTMNENAIYELGIRHALKPFSTVIMMQQSEENLIPFDLNHSRIFTYKDFGEKLKEKDAKDIIEKLKGFINETDSENVDSPLYTYLPDVLPPVLSNEEYSSVLKKAIEKEDSISAYVTRAEILKEKGQFKDSAYEWGKICELLPNNNYAVQQYALTTYKSKTPNATIALQEALQIINTLSPGNSLDLETLGITGAIYKQLFFVNKNFDYLDEAIKMYRKGFIIKNDYYNGENYANCLLMKAKQPGLGEADINFFRYLAKSVYDEVIKLINDIQSVDESDIWMYATLSTSYFAIGDLEKYHKYEDVFLSNQPTEWKVKTYRDNLERIKECLE